MCYFVASRFVYWIEERGGVERVDKYSGEERFRALPRTEKANHIVFINDTVSDSVRLGFVEFRLLSS